MPKLASMVKSKLKSSLHSYLWQEINQIPHHIHTLKFNNPYKDRRHLILEREKSVMETYTFNRKKLKVEEINAFEATWTKTGIVVIEGQPPASLAIGPLGV